MSDTSEQGAFEFLTSSAAASPAKISASPEPGAGLTGSGRGFGSSSPGSFVSYDRDSSSWKTSPLSDEEGSESYSGTWPRAGTMRAGIACPQAPSAPLTRGTGSSWSRGAYPTPAVTDYGSSQNGSNSTRPSAGTPSLGQWARAGAPRAWPTPMLNDSKNLRPAPGQLARKSPGLASSAVKLWPTPTSGDMKRSGSRVGGETKSHTGWTLTDRTCRSGPPDRATCTHGGSCRRVLNPRFVLWLMGFPRTWFDRLFERPETLSLFPSEK